VSKLQRARRTYNPPAATDCRPTAQDVGLMVVPDAVRGIWCPLEHIGTASNPYEDNP